MIFLIQRERGIEREREGGRADNQGGLEGDEELGGGRGALSISQLRLFNITIAIALCQLVIVLSLFTSSIYSLKHFTLTYR